MTWYAKSIRKETIREHTDHLLNNLKIIKRHLSDYNELDDRFWDLLKKAAEYHDIGKCDLLFQNKIHARMGFDSPYAVKRKNFVPHNFISVPLMPLDKWQLQKEEQRMLIQAVGFHHERDIEPDRDQIKSIIETELQPYLSEIEQHMHLELRKQRKYKLLQQLKSQNRISPYGADHDIFYKYVMLKGLLHRLDHAASAYVDVETGINLQVGQFTNEFFLRRLRKPKRALQHFAEKHQNEHVLAVAQTGMGKTEAALLWSGDQKVFFTLPLRVSLNAMYQRITSKDNIGFPIESTGLLHSSSMDILEARISKENEETTTDEIAEALYDQSRQLSSRLTLTTIDQIMKFPFYYKGFEKELSAMAGAKVIIDEMQSYDPKISAMIIRALEMIDQVGGSFMIMTATMPEIYRKAILNSDKITKRSVVYQKFYNDKYVRHRLKVVQDSLLNNVEYIAESGKSKKVLVICNTVQRAKILYDQLTGTNVYLLHSMYKPIDRQLLENSIKTFSERSKPSIWVTTQLVEASLDIDFDELHTEMSPLDSQFQRYGRCYRKRVLEHHQPNVFVYTQDISGIPYVYKEDILLKSIDLLKVVDGEELYEKNKMEMIDTLYSKENLQGTAFLQEFEAAMHFFENNQPYDISNEDAQRYLRDIRNIKVFPEGDEEVLELLSRYHSADLIDKRKIRRKLDLHALSVNRYRSRELVHQAGLPSSLRDFYFIEADYKFDRKELKGQGLKLEQKLAMFH